MDVKRRTVLLAVLLLLAGAPTLSTAEEPVAIPEGKAVLQATTLDEQRRILPGVTLCLKNERGILLLVSDDEGKAVMKVPGGEYSLKAGLIGFDTREITGVRLIEERELALDVLLHETEGDVLYSAHGERNDC